MAISGLLLFFIIACNKNEEEEKTNQNTPPCPETPTITDADGNIYNTVLIGDQCWMKENLRVGIHIADSIIMSDNGILEKYCYDNIPANCETYGGLYQWDEMMRYTTTEDKQGICPSGWHIPNNEDWKILEGTVDSSYPIESPVWDSLGWRGFNAGTNLKSASDWINNGNDTDPFGFKAIPVGYRSASGGFYSNGENTFFWLSNNSGLISMYRGLSFDTPQVRSYFTLRELGLSVRCLKD